MLGLSVLSAYTIMLIQLQTYVSWLPQFALTVIIIRYLIVIGVFYMSKYGWLTNLDDVTKALEDSQPSDKILFSEEHFAALKNIMDEYVFGQDHVITPMIEKIRANSEIPGRQRPIFSAAIFGPPGVGKTSLAESINFALFEHPQYLLRIDSSQFHAHDSASLFGSGKGLIGSDTAGAFTGFLMNGKGSGVILIDEPDRAAGDQAAWIQKFMPALDGRVTEISTKQEVSTRNTIIIFASNYEHEQLGAIAEKYLALKDSMPPAELEVKMRKELRKVLEKSFFPTAFLDRLDYIGVFAPLTQKIMADIVLKAIFMLSKKHNMELEHVAPEVCKTAIRVGKASENPGARTLNSWVETNVNPALAYAKRQGAKKVRIILGTNEQIYAQIVESQTASSAPTPSKTKAKS